MTGPVEVLLPRSSMLCLGVGPLLEVADPEKTGGDLNDLEKERETAEAFCERGGMLGIAGEVPSGTEGELDDPRMGRRVAGDGMGCTSSGEGMADQLALCACSTSEKMSVYVEG